MRIIARLVSAFVLAVAVCAAPRAAMPGRAAGLAASRTVLPASLVVIRRFGAALRSSPSSDARVLAMLGCGASMQVVGANAGWYYVAYTDAVTLTTRGWVGAARVADANNPPAYSCNGAITFRIGEHVYTKVRSGCLSLRVTPSRSAVYTHCVANYHEYAILNGPLGVGADDWFKVFSPSTGSGWALAQYLFPYSN